MTLEDGAPPSTLVPQEPATAGDHRHDQRLKPSTLHYDQRAMAQTLVIYSTRGHLCQSECVPRPGIFRVPGWLGTFTDLANGPIDAVRVRRLPEQAVDGN